MYKLNSERAENIADLINSMAVSSLMRDSDSQPHGDWRYWTHKEATVIIELAEVHGIELCGLERARRNVVKYEGAELSEVA
jgi:hypothetical protein